MIRLRSHIVRHTFAAIVPGDCRRARVKVPAIAGNGLGALQVQNVAQQPALALAAAGKAQGVGLFRGQSVDLLGPHPAELPQGARVAAQVHIVALVHNAAHKAGDQGPSGLHKGLQGLRDAFFDHVQHRSHNGLVAAEIRIHRDHVHRNVLLVEIPVILVDLGAVLQVHARPAGVFQGPIVVPVKEDAHFGGVPRPQQLVPQGLELRAQLGALPEHPGFAAAGVADYRPVELLAGAFGAAQLEELDGIGPMGHGLPGLGPHLPRPLKRIVGLPVLLAGGLLHEHEGLAL